MTQIKQIRQQLVREARVQGLPTEDQLVRNFSKVSRLLEGEATVSTSSILVSTSEVLASKTALWAMALLLGGGLLGGHVLYHATDSEFVDGRSSHKVSNLNRDTEHQLLSQIGHVDHEDKADPVESSTGPLNGRHEAIDGKVDQPMSVKRHVARTNDAEQESTSSQDSASASQAKKLVASRSRHRHKERARNEIRPRRDSGNSDARALKSVQAAPQLARDEHKNHDNAGYPSLDALPEKSQLEKERQFDSSRLESNSVEESSVANSTAVSSTKPPIKKSGRDVPKVPKSTLAEEIRLISLARDAKEQGKFRRAKMWLRQHSRRFPSGQLVKERLSLMRVIEGLQP